MTSAMCAKNLGSSLGSIGHRTTDAWLFRCSNHPGKEIFSQFFLHLHHLSYIWFVHCRFVICSMYQLQWRRSGKRRSPEEGLPRGLCQSQTIARHWWWWRPSETRRISFDTHSEWRQQRQQRPWRWFRKWRRPQCTWHQRQSVSNDLVSMHFSWDFFPFFDGLVFLVIFGGIWDNILVCIVCALKHSYSFQHHTHTQTHKVTPTNTLALLSNGIFFCKR